MTLDSLGEECGVLGVYRPGHHVAAMIRRGLIAMQHRGQESAGIAAVADDGRMRSHVRMGLVSDVFDAVALAAVPGETGIGHVRYSTTGESSLDNAQPIVDQTLAGAEFALAHNGNLAGIATRRVGDEGAADTRMLMAELSARGGTMKEALTQVLPHVNGSYSIVALEGSTLLAARDPHGFRPLCLGAFADGGWAVASESVAFDAVGAEFVREVSPGECVRVHDGELESTEFADPVATPCSFEYVYFARPDSFLGGRQVHVVRRELGARLAAESPVDADVVVSVPDTARAAALGYAERSAIPYDEGLARNNYVGRTFILPGQGERDDVVRLKLNVIADVVRDRRVVVVDDSIVRATSMMRVLEMVRAAGAHEVHVRIASPPVRWPCFYGVDIKSDAELIAGRISVPEIADLIGADSLGYLSVDALAKVVGPQTPCTACFSGEYPLAGNVGSLPGLTIVSDNGSCSRIG
ncbi:amidophosphoribosyltransferase [Amycolatopsis lurida]|uniref:amidophosphoribosyltransferase n=1 Tax=Amycolatopsis lurida TaxID=31959 RepID=UPI00365CF007